MPPLLILAAIGVGAYMGVKWANSKSPVARKAARTGAGKSSQTKSSDKVDAANLKQDPVSGVYRVDD